MLNPQLINLLLLALHFGITLILAATLNLWIDEAYTLNTTSQSVIHAIERSINYEIQPPLYFALLALWRRVNGSIFFARCFSVLCIGLAILVTVSLSRRYLKGIASTHVTAVLAFHPYAIWAAVEIRSYAFSILLSTLLLKFFFDGFLADQPDRRNQWLYGATAIAALYTHYFLACLLASHAFVLLGLRRWRQLGIYLGMMTIVTATFLPLFSTLLLHLQGGGFYTEHSAQTDLIGLRTALGRFLIYLLPTAADWEGLNLMRVLRYGLISLLVYLVITWRYWLTQKQMILWIMTTITVLAFGLVLSVTNTVDLAYRYSYPLFIISILLTFSLLSLVQDRKQQQRWMLGWAGLLVCGYLTSFWLTYMPLAKDGDWQRVSNYLMASEQPNQPILVFSAEITLPLSYYYTGDNPVIPLPQPLNPDVYDQRAFVLTNPTEIETALGQFPDRPSSLWLVTGPDYIVHGTAGQACTLLGFSFNCHILEEFIDRYYSVVQTQSFYGSQVRLLQRK
ncbi:MAG: hypothetical protein MUF72_03045 [Elainella sp. Prado103]|jgi:uncharacterized membrane protein|nr:hypothetical protein [Elainella sp. Prado103]